MFPIVSDSESRNDTNFSIGSDILFYSIEQVMKYVVCVYQSNVIIQVKLFRLVILL